MTKYIIDFNGERALISLFDKDGIFLQEVKPELLLDKVNRHYQRYYDPSFKMLRKLQDEADRM